MSMRLEREEDSLVRQEVLMMLMRLGREGRMVGKFLRLGKGRKRFVAGVPHIPSKGSFCSETFWLT